jgi:integrase
VFDDLGRHASNYQEVKEEARMAKRRGSGEWSISKEPSGNYRAQVSLNGERISKTFKSKEECKSWIRSMLNRKDQGLTHGAGRITVVEYLTGWFEAYKSHLRPKTESEYGRYIRQYIVPELGVMRLRDLSPSRINAFYIEIRRRGVGDRTRKFIHQVLHVALNSAVREGLLSRNPASDAVMLQYEHAEMKFLDENQVAQFLITAKGNRLEALYLLAVKTGMRQAELMGLKWEDIDWTKGTLRVQRQLQYFSRDKVVFSEPKTKAGRRIIYLGESTVQTLRAHLERQTQEKAFAGDRWKEYDLVFSSTIGTPLFQRNLLRDFKIILESAGLPKIRFHDLRHSAATLMLTNNIPLIVVSKILGHSKPSITLDIYSHLVTHGQMEAARIMDTVGTPIQIDLSKKVSDGNSTNHAVLESIARNCTEKEEPAD